MLPTADLARSQWLRKRLPCARLLPSSFRPLRVLSRAKNPCFLLRFRCEGWYSEPYVTYRTDCRMGEDREGMRLASRLEPPVSVLCSIVGAVVRAMVCGRMTAAGTADLVAALDACRSPCRTMAGSRRGMEGLGRWCGEEEEKACSCAEDGASLPRARMGTSSRTRISAVHAA